MSWRADEPYNDLPEIPPVCVELEPKSVLKAAIDARSALATLSRACDSLPNPAVLLNHVPLLEAQASSEIENIVTTTDALFRHVDLGGGDHATKEALRYRAALYAGIDELKTRPISTRTAESICSVLQGREMVLRAVPGTRIANPATREVIYAPPEGRDLIRAKLADWERFIHNAPDLDPLVRMAVAHYQFEAIHPFADGNGRTGRVLNILMMIESGVLAEPVLYLSRAIIERKQEYYQRLQAVTADGAWVDWIKYMLEIVHASAISTIRKIDTIQELQHDIGERARSATTGARNSAFLDAIFEQPYCRVATVVERCQVTRQTATSWLRALVDIGLLTETPVGRERLFINQEFIDALSQP